MASGIGKYKYETDKGNIFYCVCDDSPALDSIRGTEPTGNITESITFKESKSSKEFGLKPRTAILKLKGAQTAEGCLVNPNSITKRVPILKRGANIPQRGTELTVNGRIWIVGSVSSERSN